MLKKSLCAAIAVLFASVLVFNGCKDDNNTVTPSSSTPNAVYIQSNNAGGNNVNKYPRNSDGTLGTVSTYSTAGLGLGTSLGSQGSVVFNTDGTMLFVANAGSNDITVFAVNSSDITFKSRTASGGTTPVSLTYRNNVLYAVNAGGSGNISGFKVNSDGTLTAIAGSNLNLSNNGAGASPMPAQIQFNSAGTVLVVTEKGTNRIITYNVDANGLASGPVISTAIGINPFGFAFRTDNQLVVSQAFAGLTDSSTVASYSLNAGIVTLLSGPIRTTETAACWIVITSNGAYAYSSNTGSNSVTGFSLTSGGVLSLLTSGGVTASTGTGSSPADIALSSDSQFLYSLNGGNGTISSFKINADGSLTTVNLSAATGIGAGASGMAAK